MTGDSEHELGDAGDGPAPDSASPTAGEDSAFQPRPFRSWASARGEESKPSLWSRLRAAFGRKRDETHEDHELAAERIAPTNEYPAETTDTATADAALIEFHSTSFEEPTPMVEEKFASVEDALPAAEPSSDLPFLPIEESAPAEPKPGILSRLFRRSSKSTPRPSLEIEIHEDRIAAAADALDEVGEKTFAEGQEAPVASADPFVSVEDALPGDDERFAPPTDSRDTLEVAPDPDLGRTQDILPEFDRTLEMVELDSTMDMVRVPTAGAGGAVDTPKDRSSEDVATYFGDTLDPERFGPDDTEIEEDTDEFAVVTSDTALPVPPAVPDLDEDTARISRKSLVESLLFWRAKAKADVADGGTVVEAPAGFLFSKFRTFYNEIIRFKHQKTEFTAGFSTAIVTEYSADLSPDGAADSLSKKLAAMLELQAAEAMWMGGESAERYPDAQYAMAALADETFLNMEWEGQGAWHKNLLEPKLFKTRAADVELFKRIDKLLKDQLDSGAARDLARVYLLVIAAGFRGKYRPFGLTRALAEYRQRLYEYIHMGGDALMIYAPDRKIFPEAAQRTLEGEAVGRFSAAQKWAAILAFLVVSYTLVAHMAWSRVSADLKDVTDRIEAGTATATTP